MTQHWRIGPNPNPNPSVEVDASRPNVLVGSMHQCKSFISLYWHRALMRYFVTPYRSYFCFVDIGVGAQSTLGGKSFLPENYVWLCMYAQILCDICLKNARILHDNCLKSNIFSWFFFFGGGALYPSATPMFVEVLLLMMLNRRCGTVDIWNGSDIGEVNRSLSDWHSHHCVTVSPLNS